MKYVFGEWQAFPPVLTETSGYPVCFLWSSHSLDTVFETFKIWASIPFISLFLGIPEISFPLSNWIKQTVIYWLVNHFVHVFYKAHHYLILAKISFAWLVDLRFLWLQHLKEFSPNDKITPLVQSNGRSSHSPATDALFIMICLHKAKLCHTPQNGCKLLNRYTNTEQDANNRQNI